MKLGADGTKRWFKDGNPAVLMVLLLSTLMELENGLETVNGTVLMVLLLNELMVLKNGG